MYEQMSFKINHRYDITQEKLVNILNVSILVKAQRRENQIVDLYDIFLKIKISANP